MSFRCGRCNSLIPDPDDDFIEPMAGPIWKGKTVAEMTREELAEAVLYFLNAHIEGLHRGVANSRRMRKMQEALSREQIHQLDSWIEDHMNNIFQRETKEGKDGSNPMWSDWRCYTPSRRFRPKQD